MPTPAEIVEALLFASDTPLEAERIRDVLELPDAPAARALVDELRARYEAASGALQIVEVGGGFRLVTRPEKRSGHDQSIRGWRSWRRRDREAADAATRMIVLNTYRTLMTRGLKGCYVWAVDEGVREWLRGTP